MPAISHWWRDRRIKDVCEGSPATTAQGTQQEKVKITSFRRHESQNDDFFC